MQTHSFFTDIVLHSNEELTRILGMNITSRETIHSWPLSCVQQLVLEDGKELIYKSQLPPTVEPLFYQCTSSGLLPHHQYLGRFDRCEIMLIDKINAPLLSTMKQNAIQLLEHGRHIVKAIGEIGNEVPVYLDIGSACAWQDTLKNVLDKLGKLIQKRWFRHIDTNSVKRLRTWAVADEVLELVVNHSLLAHGDLKADQVFITPTGYQVIDWQRPVIAPPGIDLVALLVGQHIDPALHMDTTIINIFWLLRLHWAVIAQFDLFPEKRWPLFDEWAGAALSKNGY